MKIYQVHNSKFAQLIKYNIMLYPFIFYMGVPSAKLVAHEMCHIKQVQRVGWLYFYISYLYYWAKGLAAGKTSYKAYWDIPYEVEARAEEERI